MKKVHIFDTTLRDGEQAPGASLTRDGKLRLASQLAALGVDVIEPGFPITSVGEFDAVQQIARTIQGPVIVGFARLKRGDIDRAIESVRDASRRRLHLFISSSQIHLNYQLRKTPAEVIEMVKDLVGYARQYVDDIEFSPMDASRTDRDYLYEIVETALDAGATVINLPDTVGYALPPEYGRMFADVRASVRDIDRAVLSAHCHNDLGMAVANSIAALENGASIVECTLCGVGERAGNAALEELVMAIETRKDTLMMQTNIDTNALYETCRLASRLMRMPIAPNKAITGRNAFSHEAGIHQDGLLKNRATYEIMDPEKIGVPREMIVLGKHSGHHALRERANALGASLSPPAMEQLYDRFKASADEKLWMTDDDLIALLGNDADYTPSGYALLSLQQASGTNIIPTVTATVCDRRTGEETTAAATGSSVIQAALRCLQHLCGESVTVIDARTTMIYACDMESVAEANVLVSMENRIVSGTEFAPDLLTAVAKAYVTAINRSTYEEGTSGEEGEVKIGELT